MRAPWRSRVKMSLQVWKIDSMRWRIGARCGPRPGSSLRRGRAIVASRLASSASNSLPRKFLSPIRISIWPGWRSQRATICRQTSFSSTFGEVSASARGVPSKANRACSRKPQKKRRMAGAVAVVGGVGERVGEARAAATLDRLKRAGALDRRGVDEQQLVVEAGAVARELADQALDHPGQSQPALVKRGPLRQLREQVRQTLARRPRGTWDRTGSPSSPARSQSVMTSASEILLLAFPARLGRRSSTVQ